MNGSSLLNSGGGASRSPKVRSSIRRAQYQLWNDQRKTHTQNQTTFPRPSAGRRTVNSNPWAESSSAAPAATTIALNRQGRRTVTTSRRYCQLFAKISSSRFTRHLPGRIAKACCGGSTGWRPQGEPRLTRHSENCLGSGERVAGNDWGGKNVTWGWKKM